MKTHVIYLSIITAMLFYGFTSGNRTETKPEDKSQWKVTGIGGIFFKAKSTKTLKQWYSDNLGFPTDQYGTMFEYRRSDPPSARCYLQWSAFSEKTTYFKPSEKDFMINYRVQNLDAMLKDLKAKGVTICDTVSADVYGKFVHILDCENNKIELWEPVEDDSKTFEGKTIK